jgi:hypothetical protein
MCCGGYPRRSAGGVPKGGAARGVTQRIGRLARHTDDVASAVDRVAERQRGEEALLLLRGPAIVARGIGDAGFKLVESGVIEGEFGSGIGLSDRVHGLGPRRVQQRTV